MFPHVIEARHISGYLIWLKFDDGLEGTVDLEGALKGPIFELLKNIAKFRELQLDMTAGTICWPNGADIAPEYLHDRLREAIAAA